MHVDEVGKSDDTGDMKQGAIFAKGASVVRGSVHALNGVSFDAAPGRVTGLIGPSGSGKTTLMRAIIGVQQLTSGSLTVLGLSAGSKELRSKIGYQPQSPAVYGDLTVRQNLQYFGTIFGVGDHDIQQVLRDVDLTPQADQIVSSLSGGQLARVSLAVALLATPELLILDEPTVGLDPVLREKLWTLFRKLATSGRTLLISSHVMDEAERCQDILLLRDGKVLSHGTKGELLAKSKTTTVEAAFLKLAGGSHAS